MHPKLKKQFRERAVELGNSGDPVALPELVELTRSPVANVRRETEPDEYVRSHKAFQRPFCNYCFDEVFLERRNFETKVELQKISAPRMGPGCSRTASG